MAAPAHLLDHPPLRVTRLFGEQDADTQFDVLNLMTLIWSVELSEPLDTADASYVTAPNVGIYRLRLVPYSFCHARGLVGHVVQISNNQGRSIPLVEDLFFDVQPHSLAVGMHSLFLDPKRTSNLCIVALDPDSRSEASV